MITSGPHFPTGTVLPYPLLGLRALQGSRDGFHWTSELFGQSGGYVEGLKVRRDHARGTRGFDRHKPVSEN